MCLLLIGDLACAQTIRVRDDRGVLVELAAPARRVITFAPNLTELAFAAGGAKAVIAADSGSDYPEAARSLPRVSDAAGVDLEKVLALRPDLILGWLSGNGAIDFDRLAKLGIPVFLSEPRRVSDVARTLRVLGTLLGTSTVAEQQALLFEEHLRELNRPPPGARVVSVFFEVWGQPLMTLNGAHLASDVIGVCGGSNAFASMPVLAGVVDIESVLKADPEVVIGLDVPKRDLEQWRRMPSMRAVQREQIYWIDSDLLTRATPRILQGAQQVCDWLAQARRR